MPHYPAITLSPALTHGVTFAIASDIFAIDDTLDIHTSDGHSFAARIERFDMSGLALKIGTDTLNCRPWKPGDRQLRREIGTTSDWTIT